MPGVQPGDEPPQRGSGAAIRENTSMLPAAQVAAGVAGQRVGAEQHGVDEQDQRAEAHAEAVGEVERPQPSHSRISGNGTVR